MSGAGDVGEDEAFLHKKAYTSLVYLGWARARALLALGLGMSMQYDLLKFTNLYNTGYHSTKVS